MTHMTATVMLMIRFLVVNDCLGVFFQIVCDDGISRIESPDSVNPCLNYQTWTNFSLHSEAMSNLSRWCIHRFSFCQDLRALICLREDEKSKDSITDAEMNCRNSGWPLSTLGQLL